MKKKETAALLTALLGLAAGNLLVRKVGRRHRIAPEEILADVRKRFSEGIPVHGGWSEHQTVPFRRFSPSYDVYHGGLSRREGSSTVSYEFWADSKTGCILKTERTAPDSQ